MVFSVRTNRYALTVGDLVKSAELDGADVRIRARLHQSQSAKKIRPRERGLTIRSKREAAQAIAAALRRPR